jgi:two-component system OmpR family sensor kinase
MTPEVAARATERFVRGDSSRSRSTGGAGLGLAITAAIVDAHAGRLKSSSTLGEGTTVSIEIPA